jgi:hypothetical protein
VGKYVIDYNYYAEKQLRKPQERIMELVTDDDLRHPRSVSAPMTDAGIVRYLKRTNTSSSSTASTCVPRKKAKVQDIRKFFFD